jgi:hypothetical protein
MESKYLTIKRIQSLKQYLADCNSDVPCHIAWKAHKSRMQEPNEINVMVDDLATLEIGEQIASGQPMSKRQAEYIQATTEDTIYAELSKPTGNFSNGDLWFNEQEIDEGVRWFTAYGTDGMPYQTQETPCTPPLFTMRRFDGFWTMEQIKEYNAANPF